jgi:diaminohydroxyphosphoribosylaminopyrimidine deaminase / 5-amino-6-(5-phosphoribosylamino)uracil reductase
LDASDARFMKDALRLARRGLGRTSPNPAVGAVVVKDGEILARGYHKKAGSAHAEVEALDRLGGKAPGATLYVTLEPCNHYGRTPPCTKAILESGIARVVVGMKDPNPGVSGGGCETLLKGGIEVVSGVLEEECRLLNEAFVRFVLSGRPFVIVKSALTLDGFTATSTGHSQWVTNELSRQFVHRLRDRVDALMVGVGTVLCDDPWLTTRLEGKEGRSPLRVILDTRLRTPPDAKCLGPGARTLLAAGPDAPREKIRELERRGVSTLLCPLRGGRVDLSALMDRLGERNVTSLLVEGGASVIGSLIREGLVDKFHIFKAPKILGGEDGLPLAAGAGPKRMDESLSLGSVRVRRFGGDLLITGYPVKGNAEPT